jgi:sugar/nucleoside kinase (ribokinase family)
VPVVVDAGSLREGMLDLALNQGRLIRRPAYPVAAVDTTGCGDVFHAGFICGLIKGWTVDRSLDWAASRVSLKLGGRAGIPPLHGWAKSGDG